LQAEGQTPDCTWPVTAAHQLTDEWFAYDDDGRVADIWQWSTHSTQYYHSHATFFENGAIKAIQLASPSLYTLTYGLDGEGRWNTLTDTTASQNIVTGATFFPAANPAVIAYTGTPADNDAYTLDSNTGRMKKFVFTVGSTPANLTGNLTWNPNGSLAEVATTDGFNSGNSYNCYSNSSGSLGYGYDDWGRLNEFDCGSGNWGQQFSYDIYDNLSKTVLSGRTGTTWSPGYPSNNQCTGCTYDSNGDVLGDGNNVYTWNEFAKLKSATTSGSVTCGTNGNCVVYDAFGRMVESSSGSTWTEWWITQAGTESMSGATGNFGSFPTPGGNTAIVSGSIYILHTDWLGSARLAHVISSRSVYMDRGFTPYGEMYSNYGGGSGQSQMDLFAGMTDNFDRGVMWDTPNRELSIVGRWLSPDPAGTGWNQYAYPSDPNSNTDPTGLCSPTDVYGQCYIVGQDASRAMNPMNAQCIAVDGGGACAMFTGSAFDWGSIPLVVGNIETKAYDPYTGKVIATTDSPVFEYGIGAALAANNGPGFLTKLNTCVVKHAKIYSIGGVANLISNTQIPGSSLASNSITDAYTLFTGQDGLLSSVWSATKTGFQWAAAASPPVMTNGPRSFTTINPARGSPQAILGNGTNYQGLWASAKRFLKSGFELKLAIDAGLTGALVLNCSLGQIQ